MEEFLKPLKTVLPSGLTVISARSERKGIIAGEISMGIGTAHAAALDPRWEGLAHFMEHLVAFGASRNYEQDEAKTYLRDRLYLNPNASTSLTETRHFTNGSTGYVLPSYNFWQAFAATTDGIFFPKFDLPTIERERARVFEEMAQSLTQSRIDLIKQYKLMHQAGYLGLHGLGTKEQLESYTQADCKALHATYTLGNTCVSIVGDISHDEAVEKVAAALRDVPAGQYNTPILEKPVFCSGEFRSVKDGANPGFMDIGLYFPGPNIASPDFLPTMLAISAFSRLLDDRVKQKFGLYTTLMGCEGASQQIPQIAMRLITGNKDIASDVTAYALELLGHPETASYVNKRHSDLINRHVAFLEIDQAPIESKATNNLRLNNVGADLLSPSELIARYRAVRSEDVVRVIQNLATTAPMFLGLRAHPDALDVLPSIEVIDSWRATPAARDLSETPKKLSTVASMKSVAPN